MSDSAMVKTGNWVAHTVTCTCGHCRGTWELGICDYWHPNPLRRAWWSLYGKPKSKRRISRWNAHAASLEAEQAPPEVTSMNQEM